MTAGVVTNESEVGVPFEISQESECEFVLVETPWKVEQVKDKAVFVTAWDFNVGLQKM